MTKNFVHLVGLYTYCKMMHGTYNIKKLKDLSINIIMALKEPELEYT